MTIPVNARVKVTRGEDQLIGRVEEILQPSDYLALVPQLGFLVRNMETIGLTRVARISYYPDYTQAYIFLAFEIDGRWCDGDLNELTFEVIGMYGCAALAN